MHVLTVVYPAVLPCMVIVLSYVLHTCVHACHYNYNTGSVCELIRHYVYLYVCACGSMLCFCTAVSCVCIMCAHVCCVYFFHVCLHVTCAPCGHVHTCSTCVCHMHTLLYVCEVCQRILECVDVSAHTYLQLLRAMTRSRNSELLL